MEEGGGGGRRGAEVVSMAMQERTLWRVFQTAGSITRSIATTKMHHLARALPLLLLLAAAPLALAGTHAEGLKWLEENKAKPGVITLPSGLQYKVLKHGSGTSHPTVNSPCECHYAGTLTDGTEFDSSYKRGEPTTFAPNQVRCAARALVPPDIA